MAQKIEGEYLFRRQEMVAGFHFSDDGQFQFFYSYGAVDRNATGTFTVKDGTIILHSDKEPGKDFTVIGKKTQGKGYSLQFEAENKFLLNYILCIFYKDDIQEQKITDKDGLAKSELSNCDSIYVQHQLFPDILTRITTKEDESNIFHVSLNPSLEKVSFKGIDLKIEEDGNLSCFTNYFMDVSDITFIKQ